MAKKQNDAVKVNRKQQQFKSEQLQNLLKLRKQGVLTRQQFRLQLFDKGLLQNPNKGVGSPQYIEFVEIKDKTKSRGKTIVPLIKQWVKFTK